MLAMLDLAQLIVIMAIMYVFYISFVKNTSSEKLVKGLVGLGVLWGLSFILPRVHLYLLGRFVHWVSLFLSMGLIVIFQPELRKFLILLGNINGWKNVINVLRQDSKKSSATAKSIDELVKAVSYMSEKHTGALIVFAENLEDGVIERKGIKLDAVISNELLLTIFFNKTPLHDGGVIVMNNRIAYAGAILPLSQNQLQWKYGTRHRAALGMSENSDATVLIVSEESGDISIAFNGTIKKYDDMKKLRNRLEKVLVK